MKNVGVTMRNTIRAFAGTLGLLLFSLPVSAQLNLGRIWMGGVTDASGERHRGRYRDGD